MIWSERLIGMLILTLTVVLIVAAFSAALPDRFGQIVSIQARIFDSLTPYLLLVALPLILMLLAMGQGRLAGIGFAGVSIIVLFLVWDYRSRIAPTAQSGDLDVIWFNALETNTTDVADFTAALLDADADVVVFAESYPLFDVPALVEEQYPYRLGCDELDTCGILFLSRVPISYSRFRDFPSGYDRFLRVVLEVPDKTPVHLIAIHMVKPWFTGFTDTETEAIAAALDTSNPPPTIVMGDFNAAPWSRRVRSIERAFGLEHAGWPLSTWPAGAGAFGVPIDHILLRGGAAFADIEPWWGDLGSNHRGLRATIALPDAQ